mmetsp:Transcript_27659/g.64873  ORF Transcript_27659/g.64873 Transcript_27659/m.64873 type:complete len:243 (-) Transcript_27659:483-1211(-)
MEGTAVRKCSSTSIRPSRSVWMPRASRPSPSVYGRRPVATSTTSYLASFSFPPLLASVLRTTPSSSNLLSITLVLSWNLNPCFLRIVWNFLVTSASIEGQRRSMNSMTVTSVPRRDQTLPISRPMTPPPTTAMVWGMEAISRAPVESTILPAALSTGTGGRGVTSDPVARTMFLVSSDSVRPSLSSTETPLGPVREPLPLRYVTPCFLNRCSMPPVKPLTVAALPFCILATSIDTSPPITMP